MRSIESILSKHLDVLLRFVQFSGRPYFCWCSHNHENYERRRSQKVVESCRLPKIPHSPWEVQLKMAVAFLQTSKGVRRSWFPGRSSIATKNPSTKGKTDTCNIKRFRNVSRRKEVWKNYEEPRDRLLKTIEDPGRLLKPWQCLISILLLSLFQIFG